MEKIIVTLWITFGLYMMALLAIMADLWSGVRKAKKKLTGKEYNFANYFTTNDGTHPRKYAGVYALAGKIASFIVSNKTF